jgi:uncharacterized protein YjbI with pentapeptide repeats
VNMSAMHCHKVNFAGASFDDGLMTGWQITNANVAGAHVDNANMSGWRIFDANLSGLRIAKSNLVGAAITKCRLDGMTIDGVPVSEMLAAYHAAQQAKQEANNE